MSGIDNFIVLMEEEFGCDIQDIFGNAVDYNMTFPQYVTLMRYYYKYVERECYNEKKLETLTKQLSIADVLEHLRTLMRLAENEGFVF